MQCNRCQGENEDVARFCHRCGNSLTSADVKRKKSYAAQPDQPVLSFAPVGTVMPRSGIGHPRTYRYALGLTALAMVLAAVFGALPLTLALAAFAIPIVYIVYIYDVNLWEDEPVLVTLVAFALTFALGIVWTLIWRGIGDTSSPGLPGAHEEFNWIGLLTVAVLVPVVGEVLRQIGPLFLASRKEFDDLMDGFTFGVISGVAYSAAETLILFWAFIPTGFVGLGNADPLTIIVVLVQHGFIKPLLYGTATGIAGAEFSGLGKGYDGFSWRWFRAFVMAIVVVAAYQAGMHLVNFFLPATAALICNLLWTLLLLAALTLAARNVLHIGLLEAAMEAAARAHPEIGDSDRLTFCAHCEMPLLPDAKFCSVCGQSQQAVGTPLAVTNPSSESSDQELK